MKKMPDTLKIIGGKIKDKKSFGRLNQLQRITLSFTVNPEKMNSGFIFYLNVYVSYSFLCDARRFACDVAALKSK